MISEKEQGSSWLKENTVTLFSDSSYSMEEKVLELFEILHPPAHQPFGFCLIQVKYLGTLEILEFRYYKKHVIFLGVKIQTQFTPRCRYGKIWLSQVMKVFIVHRKKAKIMYYWFNSIEILFKMHTGSKTQMPRRKNEK